MIPLFIKYPGCIKGTKIDTTVSSLDLYPTILELIGVESPKNIIGKSLLPLINRDNNYKKEMDKRFHRTDSRLSFQKDRGTSIRNHSYKYIFFHDEKDANKKEEFFDINNDPLEETNLINSKNSNYDAAIDLFRKEFRKSERDAFDFQVKFLFKKFSAKNNTLISNANSIMITDSCSVEFIKSIIIIIQKMNPNIEIKILQVENKLDFEFENVEIINLFSNNWSEIDWAEERENIQKNNFDIIIVPLNISENRDNNSLRSFVKKLKARKKMFIDYNMESYNSTFKYKFLKYSNVIRWNKYEPYTLIKRIIKSLKSQ